MIRSAGIKLWMLTGDKIETAVNIAFSCKLLTPEITRYYIDEKRSVQIFKQIKQAANTQNLYVTEERRFALIVSGEALSRISKQEKL